MADFNEQLEQQLELLRRIAEKKQEISKLTEGERQTMATLSNFLTKDLQAVKSMASSFAKQLNTLKEAGNHNSQTGIKLQKQLATLNFILQKRKEEGEAVEKVAQTVRKLHPELKKQGQEIANITSALHKSVSTMEQMNMGIGAATEHIQALAAEAKKNEVGGMFAGFEGEVQGFTAGLTGLVSRFGGAVLPLAGTLAREAGGAMKKMANQSAIYIKNMIDELDTTFRGMVKQTGYYSDELQDIFINNMTGRADNVSRMVDETGKQLTMLEDIYIDPAGSVGAMTALRRSAAVFHEEIKAGRTGIAQYLSNMTAGFEKLGVSYDNSAKSVNIATKALNMSPAASVEFMKRIKAVGSSIGQDINETFTQMVNAAPDITMFGDRVIDVFGKISAQARAAGLSTDTLLKTAMKFDTFEGAADAAGKLNAVLGETAIDVMELVHADPDEKINMIRDAVTSSIGGFDQLDRRTKQVIASIMGTDVQKAAQMLGNQDAFKAYAEGLDTKAESNQKLMDQMAEAGNIDEILKGAASNAANIIQNVTALKRTGAKVVYGGGSVITGAVNIIGDTADAAIDGLKGLGSAVISGIGGAVSKAFGGGAQGFAGSPQGFSDSATKALDGVHQKINAMKTDAGKFHETLSGPEEGAPASIKKLHGTIEEFTSAMGGLKEVGTGAVEAKLKTLPGAVETFSKAMEKNSNEGLKKFNDGLTQLSTSAAALRESLMSLGGAAPVEALNNAMSAMAPTGGGFPLENMMVAAADSPAISKAAEALASGKLDAMEFAHADEGGKAKMLAELGIEMPKFEAMDRRTKTVIEEVIGPVGGGLDTLRPQGTDAAIEPLLSKFDQMLAKLDTLNTLMKEDAKREAKMDVNLRIGQNQIRTEVEEIVRKMK